MPEQRLTFLQFANELKEKFPGDKPIKVRRCQMPYDTSLTPKKRLFGDCQEKKDHWLIRISKDDELHTQKDTLMHEWAHAVAGWEENKDSHSDKWGRVYAKIYREMVGD